MGLPVVGLTGGIASGKSCAARLLGELGAVVVDADALAREVVEPGSPGLSALVSEFGPDILAADGSLDRAALGARVFQDESLRSRLNAITHPLIAQRSAEEFARLSEADAPYIVYEAALLVENGLGRGLDALVVVAAQPAEQKLRLRARDGLSEEQADARIRSQAPLSVKLAAADYVLQNRTLPELAVEVQNVHAKLLERFTGTQRT